MHASNAHTPKSRMCAIITIWIHSVILVHLSPCTIGNMEDLIVAVGMRSWHFRVLSQSAQS